MTASLTPQNAVDIQTAAGTHLARDSFPSKVLCNPHIRIRRRPLDLRVPPGLDVPYNRLSTGMIRAITIWTLLSLSVDVIIRSLFMVVRGGR